MTRVGLYLESLAIPGAAAARTWRARWPHLERHCCTSATVGWRNRFLFSSKNFKAAKPAEVLVLFMLSRIDADTLPEEFTARMLHEVGGGALWRLSRVAGRTDSLPKTKKTAAATSKVAPGLTRRSELEATSFMVHRAPPMLLP